MKAEEWPGELANDLIVGLHAEDYVAGTSERWMSLDANRPYADESEANFRRLMIEIYLWTEERTEEAIRDLKRQAKLEAFE